MPNDTDRSGDCRSEAGITIGLIDSLIAINRVLSRRLMAPFADENYSKAELDKIREAIKDIATDEDFKILMHEVAHARRSTSNVLAIAKDMSINPYLITEEE